MWKTTSKERNKKFIIFYYVLALIFVGIGLYKDDATWYIVAVVFLLMAMMRKYWLMKRLKG